MTDDENAMLEAKPVSGDLVDRVLAAKLRLSLFGTPNQTALGRLRLDGVLGRGGMGSVISAFDPVLDRRVAVKALHAGGGERDKLLREARLLAKLSHPNVVPVYDVIEDADGAYLVMEHVDGGNLRTWMSGTHGWREVVSIFVQVGEGLAAAHAQGIVHSDIKPDNIVVADGRPKLIDFGFATHSVDAAGSPAGTYAYLAPERGAGGASSMLADQYAFFVSLAEALGGGARPSWLERAVRRGTDRDSTKRFASMKEATAALVRTSTSTRVGVALGVSAIGLAVAAVAYQRSGGADVCDGSAAEVAAAWSPSQRPELVSAFVATKAPRAGDVAQRVADKLDRYAVDWAQQRTASCAATRVKKTQSEAVLDQAMACFDRQRATLQSLSRLYASADARVVGRAEALLGELGDLSSCSDRTRLSQAIALPNDPEQRQRIRALTERFEDARNLERRGAHKDALTALDGVLTDARGLAFAPLTARALVLRGAIQATLTDAKGAEETFREAASVAAQAHDDRLVAETWIRLVELLAREGRYDEALTLEPVAQASARRVADHLETAGRLANALGGIYFAKARYGDAYRHYEHAFSVQKQIGAEGNPFYTPALGNLGLAKWYAGDLAGGHANFTEALGRMTEELGPDHSSIAYVHQNLGDIERSLGKVDEAVTRYREAIRVWSTSLGDDHPNLAYPYEQLAVLHRASGNLVAARADGALALRLREKAFGPKHPLVVQTLVALAHIELSREVQGDKKRAKSVLERVFSILEQMGEAGDRQRPTALDARAQLLELGGDIQGALRDRRASLDLRIQQLGASHPDIALGHAGVGALSARLGAFAVAEREFERAVAVFDAHPDVNVEAAITTLIQHAAVTFKLGRRDAARTLLAAARSRATKAASVQLATVEAAMQKASD